jgi:hypothetical protein
MNPTIIVLPPIAVRAHSVFLSHRPGYRQMFARPAPTRVPGPGVTRDLDDPQQGMWGVLSTAIVLMFVVGCVCAVIL